MSRAQLRDIVLPVVMAIIGILLTVIGFFSVRTLDRVEGTLSSLASTVAEMRVTLVQFNAEQSSLRRDTDVNTKDISILKEQCLKPR